MISLGQVAYEPYCKARDNKAYDGSPLPNWYAVRPEIKDAWETAAHAVLAEC